MFELATLDISASNATCIENDTSCVGRRQKLFKLATVDVKGSYTRCFCQRH